MTFGERARYLLKGMGMVLQICPEQIQTISKYSGPKSLEEHVREVWGEDWRRVTGRKANGN